MRIAQGPAQRDVHRAVAHEGGAIIAAAGDAVLNGYLIGVRQFDDSLGQIRRDDIGIVHGANHETFADFRIAEALGFDRRVRADESVHSKNEIRLLTFGGETLGHFRGAYQAFFFAGGPDESDVAIFQRSADRPYGGNQRGVADTIVEAASIGARAEQRAVRFRNGDRVAEL